MTENKKISAKMQKIYMELGIQQGLFFYEKDYAGKNRLLYKMELKEVFGQSVSTFELHASEWLQHQMILYDCLEEKNIFTREMIGNKIKHFDVENFFQGEENVLIKLAVIVYHLISKLEDTAENMIWISVMMNNYLREESLSTKYYNAYAKNIVKKKQRIKDILQKTEKNSDLITWIEIFLGILLEGIQRTNEIIKNMILINREVDDIICKEKTKDTLSDVMFFIEKYPVFAIRDIENELGISYNTAAKNVAILEKQNIVCEISQKQRYRLYMYRRYMEELIDS